MAQLNLNLSAIVNGQANDATPVTTAFQDVQNLINGQIDIDNFKSTGLTGDLTINKANPAYRLKGTEIGARDLQWIEKVGDLILQEYLGGVWNDRLIVNGNTGRIKPRVVSLADGTAITPTGDTADENIHTNTQVAGTLTVNAPSGTPVDGQKLILRIKSTNAQTYAWNAIYRGSTDIALPTASTAAKTDYLGFIYNSADSKWDLVALVKGF